MKVGFYLPLIITGMTPLILLSAISPTVTAQSLNNTLHSGQFACLGVDVTFTCVTRGSDAIAWTSDVYIGAGGVQLGFVADLSNPGDRRTSVSNTDTVAMLTREYDDQGIMVLESELRITPLPDPQTATVACIHVVNGERKIANFQVIDVPTDPQDIVAVQMQQNVDSCVVHSLWRTQNDNNVTQYKILANGEEMSADTAVINTTNGIRISALFSVNCGAHEISVSASNACGQTPSTTNFTLATTPPHSIPETVCETPNLVTYCTNLSEVTATTVGDMNESMTCESTLGALIGVPVAAALTVLVLSFIALVCCIYYIKKRNTKVGVAPANQAKKSNEVVEDPQLNMETKKL